MKTLNCPNCGAPATDRKIKNCAFCGVFLLRLSPFELASSKGDIGYFRSLKPLYWVCIVGSIVSAVLIYFVFFNSLSETLLVQISPAWFLAGVFGTCGLYTERAVRFVITKKAGTFTQGLQLATQSVPPFPRLFVWLIFSVPFVLFGIGKQTSPLLITFLTTAAWAGVLYFFLVGIFPAL